jgi:hypothetical protein
MSDNYSEFANVAGTNVQVFAMRFEDGKQVWSIGADTNGVGVRIGDTTEESVKSLKQLRTAINGAIKFMNDKQGNTNDEPKI